MGERTVFAVLLSKIQGGIYMNIRNEIKAQIVRAGYTMQELVDKLHDEYGWCPTSQPSSSGNLSATGR